MANIKKTYEPDNSIKKGYFSLFGEIYRELKSNTWLTFQFFKRDFLAIYKQSFIGVLWAFIIPLISVGTFVLLNRAGIFNIGTIKVPYAIYAVLGISIWQLFSTGLLSTSNSLVKAGSMIIKINFSKKTLVIAAIGQALISFLVQFLLVIILFFIYNYSPNLYILLTPILIIPIILFTLGFGFILSLLNGVFRDIGNILSVLITFLMFLTPVLYSTPTKGLMAVITKYNPLFYLITVPRDIILFGESTNVLGFLISTIISIFVFVICIVIFHLTETRVAERI
ncbi:ABC transporter permease [Candidatus Dependentiae bacterium]|nr:ABC transporter permease [Candidatus Dependentiae bacterium]